MRDSTGGPNVRVRLLALVLALGMLVLAAPGVLTLLRWLGSVVL